MELNVLIKSLSELKTASRWDIDFHLPPQGILRFPQSMLRRVDDVADVTKDKRDPTREPESTFMYIDISAVDVTIGAVSNPQEVDGADAPSRARKVVRAFDILISTCRPTRGAIAVVPIKLHNQIASTGFSIVRAHKNVNPFYLQYALRLPSTLEQFRKWSTGSSYPAILDSDVKKTLIPMPPPEVQDQIAMKLMQAFRDREVELRSANKKWTNTLDDITSSISVSTTQPTDHIVMQEDESENVVTIKEVCEVLQTLPPLSTESSPSGLFANAMASLLGKAESDDEDD